VTLSEPSTITVKYLEADMAAAGGGTEDLVLAYWDEAAGNSNGMPAWGWVFLGIGAVAGLGALVYLAFFMKPTKQQ